MSSCCYDEVGEGDYETGLGSTFIAEAVRKGLWRSALAGVLAFDCERFLNEEALKSLIFFFEMF